MNPVSNNPIQVRVLTADVRDSQRSTSTPNGPSYRNLLTIAIKWSAVSPSEEACAMD